MKNSGWKLLCAECLVVMLTFYQMINAQWIQTGGLEGGHIEFLGKIGGALLVEIEGGAVFRSNDHAATWNLDNSGLSNTGIQDITPAGSSFFAVTDKGVFISADNGARWVASGPGLPDTAVYSLTAINGTVFAVTPVGVYRTVDNGSLWTAALLLSPEVRVHDLVPVGDTIIAFTDNGIYHSVDNGAGWEEAATGLVEEDRLYFLGEHNGCLYATIREVGLFSSGDKGISWKNRGLRSADIREFAENTTTVFVAGDENAVYFSTDEAAAWTHVDSGLTCSDHDMENLTVCGDTLFGSIAGAGIFALSGTRQCWRSVNTGLTKLSVNALTVNKHTLFAGTGFGLFSSSDGGTTWIPVNSGLIDWGIHALAADNESLYAGSYYHVYRSTDNAGNWFYADTGIIEKDVLVLAASNNKVVAGMWKGIYISQNCGSAWKEVTGYGTGLPYKFDCTVTSLLIHDAIIFAGVENRGLFLTADDGTKWSSAGFDSLNVNALADKGNIVFAGTDSGLYLSSDNGTTWSKTEAFPEGYRCWSCMVSDGVIYAGGDRGYICCSHDGGSSWEGAAIGLSSADVTALTVMDGILYAGLCGGTNSDEQPFYGRGVWRRPIAEMAGIRQGRALLTNFRTVAPRITAAYGGRLPVTVTLTLSQPEIVECSVHSLSGRRVATFANALFLAGVHRVTWNPWNNANGCYVVKTRIGTVSSKKVITILRQ